MPSFTSGAQVAALLRQAAVCHEQGKLKESLALYERAISAAPHNFEALNDVGILCGQLGLLEKALHYFNAASKVRPGDFTVHYNRAKALQELGRHQEALDGYDKALALRADYVPAYNNRGNVLKELKRYDEALASYDQALSLRPGFLVTYINQGSALQDLKRYGEALAAYDRALARKPDYAEANYNKGLVKLLLGDYEEGWALHEWRWRTEQYKNLYRAFRQPLWLGEQPLAGRTILLHADQGLGDAIQFARYVPLVAALGASVILEVQPSLVALFATLHDAVTVVAKGDVLPEFDLHCPLMSLPLAFKTKVTTMPAVVPYIRVDLNKQREWRERLGPKVRPRVGLVWSGNAKHNNDRNRSMSLQSMQPLLIAECEFHALHKEVRGGDRETLAQFQDIHRHEDQLFDFADTAALVSELDLIITVDTAVAHLAGALGKEVWILLPYVADYRWLTGRGDSPWYPSAQLIRQNESGDWRSVIDEVRSRLMRLYGPASG